MKKPDEIKKALECCFNAGQCADCPYYPVSCDRELVRDAREYIQQLEAERDAYREELKTELGCNTCKHFDNDAGSVSGYCEDCKMWRNWEWRGVQKEDGNA